MSYGRLSIIVATVTLLMTAHAGMAADRQIDVCFTPGMDCTGKVVEAIGTARRTILIQAYSFTSPAIAQALVQAKKRGVDVRAVLDKSQRTEKYSGADFLANGGVRFRSTRPMPSPTTR